MSIRRPRSLVGAVVAALTALAVLAGCAPAVAPGTGVDPADDDRPLVAFYGDSYTLGTGASDLSVRWSTQLAERRGWREFNPSVNGLGFINNRRAFADTDLPALIIDQQPDIVIVTMGLNDSFSFDARADEIEQQIDTDLARLTEALPEARIVVVEPFWYTAERPASLETIIGWVRAAAERYDLPFIPGASTWIAGAPGLMATDGLHPNDEGYALMLEKMDAALAELGL
ncbi:SGNH/GDSL hydrolase family protein [Microcella frigidaquae]|uniref:Lysophospholipase L1-like esterase n=1 Tax=Microcella frigidaquae TaxID=424758 RepID=A0A840XBE7_9MICO|nr:SGNH/GDSL hydrolase family protein [Microcella frigidaquae]MBB5618375.1 lysophospholipase L1-like esterase [Microcella frigidaquae]NHN44721.1 SGNH/GDSL hydrolase family protein [Microcella frigidaquae]